MKKVFAIMLAVVLLLSCGLLSACQKDESDGVITIWQQADDITYYSDYNDNPIVTAMEKKFGVDFQFQIPAMGSESDNFNLMLGTGDYTDVITLAYSSDTSKTLYEDGVIIDLAPYLEEYMPNYWKYLQDNPTAKAAITDDEGHIFNILVASKTEDETMWGGLVYRRDIIETMTGGYVSFPSGNEEPTTIEDWEYMLGLFQQYFEAAKANGGSADYACLILPYNGYFHGGELISGFGVATGWVAIDDNGVPYIGATKDGFRNYLAKMNEWYKKGWIYQDFASRVNDVFYLPNTSLTYGNAAGIWYGIAGAQAGSAMSMPEYGLYYDVQPLRTPLDTEHGITESHSLLTWTNFSADSGWAITTKCGKQDMINFMTATDWLFTEEGGMIVTLGLTEEYAKDNEVYQKLGLEKGTWGYNADGTIWVDERCFGDNTTLEQGDLKGTRLPGAKHPEIEKAYSSDIILKCDEVWTECGRDWVYPAEIVLTPEQNAIYQEYYQNISDCIAQYCQKFIMGNLELNDENWAKFQKDLKTYHIDDLLAVYTEAYNDFVAKMN